MRKRGFVYLVYTKLSMVNKVLSSSLPPRRAGGSRACRISIYNSTVQFKGKNAKIDIAGFHESYGIVMKGGSKVDMEFGSTTKIFINGYDVT